MPLQWRTSYPLLGLLAADHPRLPVTLGMTSAAGSHLVHDHTFVSLPHIQWQLSFPSCPNLGQVWQMLWFQHSPWITGNLHWDCITAQHLPLLTSLSFLPSSMRVDPRAAHNRYAVHETPLRAHFPGTQPMTLFSEWRKQECRKVH